MQKRFHTVLASMLALAGLVPAAAVSAEDALRIELNAVDPQDGACRLIFVAENETGSDLSALVLEAVLFGSSGRVEALTLLDFRDLPAARLRVRSFDMAGVDCAGISRLLINDVATCDGAVDCASALSVSSRVPIEMLQ